MKHLKMIGLALMAATALMAFASSASATVLTSPANTEYTGELDASATESLFLEASVFNVTCTGSTVKGTVTTNTTVASGAISSLTYTGCDATVKVIANGSLEVKGTPTGDVYTSGNKVTVEKIGISCVYGGGAGTKIGTMKGGTTASMQIEASLPKQEGGFLCAANAKWTGKYTVTAPDTLILE
jgi:hypothetical protein